MIAQMPTCLEKGSTVTVGTAKAKSGPCPTTVPKSGMHARRCLSNEKTLVWPMKRAKKQATNARRVRPPPLGSKSDALPRDGVFSPSRTVRAAPLNDRLHDGEGIGLMYAGQLIDLVPKHRSKMPHVARPHCQ